MKLVPIKEQTPLISNLLSLLSNDLVMAILETGFTEKKATMPEKGNWLSYHIDVNKKERVSYAIKPYKILIFYRWEGRSYSQVLSFNSDKTFLQQWKKLGDYIQIYDQ